MENKESHFRININCGGSEASVKPHLDNGDGVRNWNVNTIYQPHKNSIHNQITQNVKTNIIQIFLALLVMGSVLSCTEDEDIFLPQDYEVKVDFDSSHFILLENEAQNIIQLSFNRKTTRDGSLTLSLSDVDQSRYHMDPAISNGKVVLNVLKDQESAILKINPINNSLSDGNLDFSLEIINTTTGFTIGERKSLSIRLMDDDSIVTPQQSRANFIQVEENVVENDLNGRVYTISLSERLISQGTIDISPESTKAIYEIDYYTIPSINNGKLTLSPSIGETEAKFTIIPIDNATISGNHEITFTITGTTGSIIKGSELIQSVSIVDDELINMPKGWISGSGIWALKKIYEYDEMGRIKFVDIEQSTPATSKRRETYFYGIDGRIQKINTYPQIDIVYSWSNDRIIKSETVDNGKVKGYIEYDYDIHGNVSGTANYYRQSDGQYKLGFVNIFLYFLDGNLYKSQTYIQISGSEDFTLKSTQTYDQYINAVNPFPMVDILPTVKTQTKLPSIYTIEENGMTLQYNLTYEFTEDGLVHKRIVSGENSSESTQYIYY